MLKESELEVEVSKSSKFSQIVNQFKEWRDEKAFFNQYFNNCLKILFGYEPTDYKVISHNNRLAHSFIRSIDNSSETYVSKNNILVHSKIYNRDTGRYE